MQIRDGKYKSVFGMKYSDILNIPQEIFGDKFGKKYSKMSRSKFIKTIKREANELFVSPKQRNKIVVPLNKIYSHFQNAKYRCSPTAVKNRSYKHYSGKGIRFFLTFNDVLYLYIRDHAFNMQHPSIDRMKSSGHYELSNCRFIESSLNSRLKGDH